MPARKESLCREPSLPDHVGGDCSDRWGHQMEGTAYKGDAAHPSHTCASMFQQECRAGAGAFWLPTHFWTLVR